MKQKIFLIHGIRAKDKGVSSMEGLQLALAHHGFFSTLISYGYVLIPISNERAIEATIEAIEAYQSDDYEVIVVGYSNGCWTAVQVAEMGYKIDRMFLISPALHKYHEIPRHVKSVDVFFSDEDIILSMAKWHRWISHILPWRWFGSHEWGEAGKYGLLTGDPRITNHDMGSTGHTFFNYEEAIDLIANRINEVIK